jgi:hypothetical protein
MLRRAWPIVLGALFVPARALAGNCDGVETSGCIDSDTFWPHAGPRKLMAVGGSETIAKGTVGFGLVGSYQHRPVMLSTASGQGQVKQAAIDNQITSTFLFSYGVTKKLELDGAIPVTIFQDGAGTQPITGGAALHDTTARDLRFGVTYAVIPHVAARFAMSAPTADKNGQFAGDRGVDWIPSLAADYRIGRFFFGAEVGARLRATTGFIGARIGSQLVVAGGAGFDILDKQRLAITAEARALPTFAEQQIATQTDQGITTAPGGGFIAPAEWMVSARSAPVLNGDLTLQLGGGSGIGSSITTPMIRIALAIVYAPKGDTP